MVSRNKQRTKSTCWLCYGTGRRKNNGNIIFCWLYFLFVHLFFCGVLLFCFILSASFFLFIFEFLVISSFFFHFFFIAFDLISFHFIYFTLLCITAVFFCFFYCLIFCFIFLFCFLFFFFYLVYFYFIIYFAFFCFFNIFLTFALCLCRYSSPAIFSLKWLPLSLGTIDLSKRGPPSSPNMKRGVASQCLQFWLRA